MAPRIHEVEQREHGHDEENSSRLYPDDISMREIEEDIDYTRSEMDETIHELFDRLTPKHLFRDALSMIRSSIRGTGHQGRHQHDGDYDHHESGIAQRAAKAAGKQLVQTVKNHPIPSAMVTAGLVWMLIQDDRPTRQAAKRRERFQQSHGYQSVTTPEYRGVGGAPGSEPHPEQHEHPIRERIGDAAHSVREGASRATEKAGEWIGQARDRVTDTGEYIAHRASDIGGSVREGMHKARHAYDETMEKHPLAIGIACIGVGLVAGMLLPHTKIEDKHMGEASEHFRKQATQRGADVAERAVESAATATVSEATRETQHSSEHEPEHEHDLPRWQESKEHGGRFRGSDI